MLNSSSMAGLVLVLLATSTGAQAALASSPARSEPYAALSAEQEHLLRLPVRRDYFRNVMSTCEAMFPSHGARYRRAVADWEAPHRAELEQAARLADQRSYRVHAREMAPLIEQEGQALFAWQAEALGIAASRQPDAQDCDRFAEGIGVRD